MNTNASTLPSEIAPRFGSGHAVQRIEDEGLLKGIGQFTDDLAPAGHLHACFLRSPYPHAKIVSIDTASAKAMPGVAGVYTGAEPVAAGVNPIPGSKDFKRAGGAPGATPLRRPLAQQSQRRGSRQPPRPSRFLGRGGSTSLATSPGS